MRRNILQGRQVTYLSRAGRLVAMFVTRYTPDTQLKAEMQRAETNGISFLIRTTDYIIMLQMTLLQNSTICSIAVSRCFRQDLGNVLREAEDTVEETSRSYSLQTAKPHRLPVQLRVA